MVKYKMENLKESDFEKLDHTENILSSCCGGSSDKRLITILTQILVSLIVLIFACVMLIIKEGDSGIYLSLITSCMSYWLGKNENLR